MAKRRNKKLDEQMELAQSLSELVISPTRCWLDIAVFGRRLEAMTSAQEYYETAALMRDHSEMMETLAACDEIAVEDRHLEMAGDVMTLAALAFPEEVSACPADPGFDEALMIFVFCGGKICMLPVGAEGVAEMKADGII